MFELSGAYGWKVLIFFGAALLLMALTTLALFYAFASWLYNDNPPLKVEKITEDDLKARRAYKKYIRRTKD